MLTYNRYINQEDHVWHDSSNIIYSKCYDTQQGETKTLKIVFKGGRTYLYKDVDVKDYVMFKTAQSSGDAFNKYVKKYKAVRIADTNIDKLNELRESFQNEQKETDEQKFGDLVYHIQIDKANSFRILLGDKTLFKAQDSNFSIMDLIKSLNLHAAIEQVDELPNESDELLEEIVIK